MTVTKRAGAALAAAVVLAALPVVAGFSTRDARGNAVGFQSYISTALVIGPSGATFANGRGRSHLSIGTSGTAGTTTTLRIGSGSLISSPDTITINAGGEWSGYFNDGIDSLRILTVASGGRVNVNVTQ